MTAFAHENHMSLECFHEFNDDFSRNWVPKFREVFHFVEEHAGHDYSMIRKLHLGYTAMREPAFDFIACEFPWLEDFRREFGLVKRLNFLETDGFEKREFKPHIDGSNGNPTVMFNVPIQNCTLETKTYWVQPLVEVEPVLLCENGTNGERLKGATPHLPPDAAFKVICEHSFTTRCALFRSDIFHGVINDSRNKQSRIMMHWWYPPNTNWGKAKEKNRLNLL